MNIEGQFVVGGDKGPGSGIVWPSLRAARKYRDLLLELNPGSTQEIYLLVRVPTGGTE